MDWTHTSKKKSDFSLSLSLSRDRKSFAYPTSGFIYKSRGPAPGWFVYTHSTFNNNNNKQPKKEARIYNIHTCVCVYVFIHENPAGWKKEQKKKQLTHAPGRKLFIYYIFFFFFFFARIASFREKESHTISIFEKKALLSADSRNTLLPYSSWINNEKYERHVYAHKVPIKSMT